MNGLEVDVVVLGSVDVVEVGSVDVVVEEVEVVELGTEEVVVEVNVVEAGSVDVVDVELGEDDEVVVVVVVVVGTDDRVVEVDAVGEGDVVSGPDAKSLTAGENPRSAEIRFGSFPSIPRAQIPMPAKPLVVANCAAS
jgi:hypothetical protein